MTSLVWNLFEKYSDTLMAKCLLCEKEYSYKGSITNLKKHLRNKHPSTYEDFLNIQKDGAIAPVRSIIIEHHSNSDDEQIVEEEIISESNQLKQDNNIPSSNCPVSALKPSTLHGKRITAKLTASKKSATRNITSRSFRNITPKVNKQESMVVEKISNKARNTEDDLDMMFFKSLLPDVKRLSPNQKFEFRLRIMQIYKEIITTPSQSNDVYPADGTQYNSSSVDPINVITISGNGKSPLNTDQSSSGNESS